MLVPSFVSPWFESIRSIRYSVKRNRLEQMLVQLGFHRTFMTDECNDWFK